MRGSSWLLPASALMGLVAGSPVTPDEQELDPRFLGASLGCSALKLVHGSKTFSPGDSTYEWENQQFWSNTQLLSPKCIFRPTSANEVSAAILTSRLTQSKFAVRGGAHMAIEVSTPILEAQMQAFGLSHSPGGIRAHNYLNREPTALTMASLSSPPT